MKKIFFTTFCLYSLSTWAQVGPKYAIEAYSTTKGLKIYPKAIARLKVEVATIGQWPLKVHEDGVVFIKDQSYIYLVKNDFYVLTPVVVKRVSPLEWELSGEGVRVGETFVSKKAELLHLGQIMNQAAE